MMNISNLKVSFDKNLIIKNFSNDFEKSQVVTIIGPNGSGKSTVLRAIAKLIKKDSGKVIFEGTDINKISSRQLAQKLAILMQSNTAPTSFTVKQLVAYGRIPHQKWFETKDKDHDEVVEWALKEAAVKHMEDRIVSSLSGGERQKVWIATALAQKPEVLFLDEPTTYLDICHQLEIMQLVKKLNQEHKISVVMVLHDLNQAIQFSDKIIVLKKGEIVGCGVPNDVITEALLEDVYNIKAHVEYNHYTKSVCIVPICLKTI